METMRISDVKISVQSFEEEHFLDSEAEKQHKREDEAKIKAISYHFKQIMVTLGLDLSDDSLKDTPERVAKMYVKEIFRGLDPPKQTKNNAF